MVLAAPIQHPDSGAVLLRRGFALNAAAVKRLRTMHLPEVWIEYPDGPEFTSLFCPKIASTQQEVGRLIGTMFSQLHAGAHARLDYQTYRTAIGGLVNAFRNNRRAAQWIGDMAGESPDDARHAGQVALTSVVLGIELEAYLMEQRRWVPNHRARDVVSLGVGAALHDIGLTEIPDEVRQYVDRTGDRTVEAWRDHARLGYELVSGAVDATTAAIVLHHHQAFDGSGFPDPPQSGEDIHVFCRIVAVADTYDRLRRPPTGAPVAAPIAIGRLFDPASRDRFDPEVLWAFLRVVPVFAPGSMVTMADGSEGVVLGWQAAHPFRPTVHLMGDDEPVQLTERPELTIVSHDGLDLSADLPAAQAAVDEYLETTQRRLAA